MKKRGHVGPTQIKKKRKRIRREEREADREGNVFIFIFFSSIASLFDIRKSNRQNSSGQEIKRLYSTRATRKNQKHGISPSF